MTKHFHRCNASCRPLANIGNLLRAIDDTRGKVDSYSRIIDGISGMDLDVYEDEALTSYLNARFRQHHILEALERRLEELTQ